ncbi:hypothetical protein ZHAS_00001141 [Anopheles sinensis]|uniref:Uncharacterized protein n=1 Tax=Anopheles sinensis TaxID=74873 RepID=A0A084VB33_ANOSI|nr:hypothetical protein ZHAS_00001141 [Anopheles sinensis]
MSQQPCACGRQDSTEGLKSFAIHRTHLPSQSSFTQTRSRVGLENSQKEGVTAGQLVPDHRRRRRRNVPVDDSLAIIRHVDVAGWLTYLNGRESSDLCAVFLFSACCHHLSIPPSSPTSLLANASSPIVTLTLINHYHLLLPPLVILLLMSVRCHRSDRFWSSLIASGSARETDRQCDVCWTVRQHHGWSSPPRSSKKFPYFGGWGLEHRRAN